LQLRSFHAHRCKSGILGARQFDLRQLGVDFLCGAWQGQLVER
jgi:hypothetical protein